MKRLFKVVGVGLLMLALSYMGFVAMMLSVASTTYLTAHIIIDHQFSNFSTFPIPFNREVAFQFLDRSLVRDADIIYVNDILMLADGLKEEGLYQGYAVLPDAKQIGFLIAEKAIKLGAYVDRFDSFGCTSLQRAATSGDKATIAFLIDHGADQEIENKEASQAFCHNSSREILEKSVDGLNFHK